MNNFESEEDAEPVTELGKKLPSIGVVLEQAILLSLKEANSEKTFQFLREMALVESMLPDQFDLPEVQVEEISKLYAGISPAPEKCFMCGQPLQKKP